MYAMSSSDARRVLEAGGAKGLEGSLAEDEVLFKRCAPMPGMVCSVASAVSCR